MQYMIFSPVYRVSKPLGQKKQTKKHEGSPHTRCNASNINNHTTMVSENTDLEGISWTAPSIPYQVQKFQTILTNLFLLARKIEHYYLLNILH